MQRMQVVVAIAIFFSLLQPASAGEQSGTRIDGRQLVIIQADDVSPQTAEQVLQVVMTGALQEADSSVGREKRGEVLLSMPRESVDAKAITALKQRGGLVEYDDTSSKILVVLKGLGLEEVIRRISGLSESRDLLNSYSLGVIDDRRERQQVTVSPSVAALAITLANKLKPVKAAGSPLQITDRCRIAAEKIGTARSLVAIIGGNGSPNGIQDGVEYRDACLSPVVNDQNDQALPQFVAGSGAVRIMGLLEYSPAESESVRIFCSAFLLDEKRVMTARHCFYSTARPGDVNTYRAAMSEGKVYFQRMSYPYQRIKIESEVVGATTIGRGFEHAGSTTIKVQADVMVLKLATPADDVPKWKWEENPVWRQGAWIAGPVDFYDYKTSGVQEVPDSVKASRWPSGMECAVLPQDNGCQAHICQAMAGFSGAPLLVKSNAPGEILVSGMHIGPYSEARQDCPPFKRTTSHQVVDLGFDVNLAISAGNLKKYLDSIAK